MFWLLPPIGPTQDLASQYADLKKKISTHSRNLSFLVLLRIQFDQSVCRIKTPIVTTLNFPFWCDHLYYHYYWRSTNSVFHIDSFYMLTFWANIPFLRSCFSNPVQTIVPNSFFCLPILPNDWISLDIQLPVSLQPHLLKIHIIKMHSMIVQQSPKHSITLPLVSNYHSHQYIWGLGRYYYSET